MRKLTFALLVVVLFSIPALGFSPRDSYVNDVAVIAWQDGGTLHVGIGNTSNNRTTVTISTTTVDAWGRPVFANRQVTVPGRTIFEETIRPNAPGRNQTLSFIRVSDGYRSVTIPVQNSELLRTRDFIIPANTDIELSMDLGFLFQDMGSSRLIIDEFYQAADGSRGPIKVAAFEGGLRYVRFSNSIEFTQPYMVLTMKAPQITGLTTMAFSLRRTEDGYSRRDEIIDGPVFLVYGRNYRYTSSPTPTGPPESTRIPR